MSEYIPARGDICWLNFNPQMGSEQAKRRPALVISSDVFNQKGLAFFCPITSSKPRHGFHVKLPSGLLTKGCIMSEQLKSLDWLARKAEFIEKAPLGVYSLVRGIIEQIL